MKQQKNSLKIFFQKIPSKISIFLIVLYRTILSPSVGILRFIPGYPRPSCVFYPTCSEYSIMCFKQYSFLKAVVKTIKRVRRCHPGTDPMVDMP